jgi:predicted PurR-regulated permease PerM
MPNLSTLLSEVPGQLGTATGLTFGVFVDLFVLFFVGLYLAIDPGRYLRGFLRLFPGERRSRLREVATVLTVTLQRWIVGRLVLMLSNAIITALGLWLLGMRLPVTLGIFSGLLNFVPNLGTILAAVPAVLLAFVQGPSMALSVALFYLGYQMLDGYVLTPLVQRQTVALPPALTIISQVLLGALFGTYGVLFAVPLVASSLVAIKMLYLRDVLGERIELPHSPAARKGER